MITNYNESQPKQSDNKGLTLNVIMMHLEEKETREAIMCIVNGVTTRHIYTLKYSFFFFNNILNIFCCLLSQLISDE